MAKKQKRARLIYNPTSGQEIMKKNVAEVLDVLEGFGYETSAFQTHQSQILLVMRLNVPRKLDLI